MKQRYCQKCHLWLTGDQFCPHTSKFNKTLRTAMLNNHLYQQADRVTKERTDQAHFVKQAKREAKRVARS